MDTNRLKMLAGIEVDERPVEILEEARGRVDTVRNVAYQLYQLAESNAYDESEAGHQPVTGHSINHEYEVLKEKMDQYVQELIKGEHN